MNMKPQSSWIIFKSTTNPPQIDPQIDQKSTRNRPQIALEGVSGPFGYPKLQISPKLSPKMAPKDPPGDPRGTHGHPKVVPEAPRGRPKAAQGSKMEPKWCQNSAKMCTKTHVQIQLIFLAILQRFLISFLMFF